jgi:hypothetical protein
MTIATNEPEWDDVDPSHIDLPQFTVVAIKGRYSKYLEQRLPPFVQSQAHWCSKNLTTIELDPLVAAATRIENARLKPSLYAQPSLSAEIEEFPEEFVVRMTAADDRELRAVAEKWAAMMSAPEYTHSVSGKRLYDDLTVDHALNILKPLANLAKQCRDGQSMYLLTEA